MEGRKEEKEEQDQSVCKETVDLKSDILFMATTDTKSGLRKNKIKNNKKIIITILTEK